MLYLRRDVRNSNSAVVKDISAAWGNLDVSREEILQKGLDRYHDMFDRHAWEEKSQRMI